MSNRVCGSNKVKSINLSPQCKFSIIIIIISSGLDPTTKNAPREMGGVHLAPPHGSLRQPGWTWATQ